MTQPAGYSKTPLARKLGLKSGMSAMLMNPPKLYHQLFEDMPEKINWVKTGPVDFIHIFITTQHELERDIKYCKDQLNKNGLLWVSWPKGTSKIETDINRDSIREYVLQVGLVDVKVAAVDNDWSALKFVYRLKDR